MSTRSSHPAGWLSYDSVALTYDRVAVPWFEPMARDLVAAVGVTAGESILDVGTGTGLTADLASGAVKSGGVVIGADPSTGMLGLARGRRHVLTVAAMAPGLPFPDASFNAVLANLVLSHLPDLAWGLADMVRVLRGGGRLGVTAWGPDPASSQDQGSEADGIVASVREACGLPSETPVKGAPWEQQLRSRAELCDALTQAGLLQTHAQLYSYRRTFTIDDYLSGWGGLGRYLRWQAGEQRWAEFTDRATTELQQRVGNTIISVKQAWVATGTTPQRPLIRRT